MTDTKVYRDRELLNEAQAKGPLATLAAYFRLSGPGWLQSAITLGGGSLAGALYLGVVGGTSMIWMQLVAIVAGVVMLSAISYVTLSTGLRPFAAINQYVNPVLGVGWVLATILANMIFIMPQFSLCFDACQNNLLQDWMAGDSLGTKITFSIVVGLLAFGIVVMNLRPGLFSKIFDLLLKAIVAMIVVCFVLVVVILARDGQINWAETFWGCLPNFSQWNSVAPKIQTLLTALPESSALFWTNEIVSKQQPVMISSAATAVGINMTFLLPYSMLARGWGKTFRGLAVWDLVTGMAIPFVIVTSCIVIASASAFHTRADAELLSSDPSVVETSEGFLAAEKSWQKRLNAQKAAESEDPRQYETVSFSLPVLAAFVATLPEEERRVSMAVVQPDSKKFGRSLVPLLGEQRANMAFGFGVLGMGFSTIVILMLINGYAVAELAGNFQHPWFRAVGSLVAALSGASWFWVWGGASKTYLAIVASTFAVMLLPIAYLAFFLLMNNFRLMQGDFVRGGRRWLWNSAMLLALAGAVSAAVSQLLQKSTSPEGAYVIGGASVFLALVVVGFAATPKSDPSENVP